MIVGMNLTTLRQALSILVNVLNFLDRILGNPKTRGRARPASKPRTTSRVAGQKASALKPSPRPEPPSASATRPASRPAPGSRPSIPWLSFTLRALTTAAGSGLAVYYVMRRRQRQVRRARPLAQPFPEALLEILASPGGGRELVSDGSALLDPDTSAAFPVVDGIPDFGGADISSTANDLLPWPRLAEAVMGANLAGHAALAGTITASAEGGWCLSVPCGDGRTEVEMARANPHTRILCLDWRWDRLREARLRAVDAGLANLYFARGDPQLLPLKTRSIDSVWAGDGAHRYPRMEQAVVELARVLQPGALVGGFTLAPGGGFVRDRLLVLTANYLPGLRPVGVLMSLLAVAGLRDLHAVRDGAYVRFLGIRA